MELSTHGLTDTGLVRPQNEDTFYCGQRVFVVADGLGGHAAGEVASALAVEPLAALDGRLPEDPVEARAALAEAARQANERVWSDAQAHPDRSGMGTTLTAAAVSGGALVLAHVGDSRAYLLRHGQLEQLTADHDLAGEAVRAGRLSPEEALLHPERHVLTRALGLDPQVSVDTPEPLLLEDGDRLLLCSDGLTGVVGEAAIAALLSAEGPEAACAALVRAALSASGPDNVTVVVVDVEQAS